MKMKLLTTLTAIAITVTSFTPTYAATEVLDTKLTVPLLYQARTLSCEVASLRMALAYQGASVSETELVNRLTYDTTPHVGNTWGDPQQGFIGNINGRMGYTGYGVYTDPIASLGLQWRRTETIKNGTLQELTSHLDQKHPVIIWGYYGAGGAWQWSTPKGVTINAVNGEHARVLTGYKGNASDPEGFYLNDPIAGKIYWTKATLLKNWSSLENSAVAVFPFPHWIKTGTSNTVWEIAANGSARHALAMSWETFLNYGYKPKGIVTVSNDYLNQFTQGADIN